MGPAGECRALLETYYWRKEGAKVKKKIFAAILVCAMLLMVIAPTTAFANWIQQSDGSWVYYDIDNHIYYADGIYTIDGKDYYFDINGVCG